MNRQTFVSALAAVALTLSAASALAQSSPRQSQDAPSSVQKRIIDKHPGSQIRAQGRDGQIARDGRDFNGQGARGHGRAGDEHRQTRRPAPAPHARAHPHARPYERPYTQPRVRPHAGPTAHGHSRAHAHRDAVHHRSGSWGRELHRGAPLPGHYRAARYHVNDWRAHRLSAPPRGHHWVQVGADYALVAVATGVIAHLLMAP